MADIVLRHPASTIPLLFEHLDASEAARRTNALYILNDVATRDASVLTASEAAPLLRDHLFARLSGDDLEIRRLAAQAFSRMDPAAVLPRIAAMLSHADARTRSAALETMVETLLSPASDTKSFSVFLDVARDIVAGGGAEADAAVTIADSPGDLLGMASPVERRPDDAVDAQRFVHVVQACCRDSTRSTAFCDRASRALLAKVWAAPQEPVLIQVGAVLLAQLEDASAVLNEVTERARAAAPTGPALEAAVFARLAPLLVANMVAPAALASWASSNADTASELLALLVGRLQDASESPGVRQMAAAVLGRWPHDALGPRVASDLSAAVDSSNWDACRPQLAIACAVLSGPTPPVAGEAPWLADMMDACVRLVGVETSDVSDSLHRAQLGSIEAMATMALADARASSIDVEDMSAQLAVLIGDAETTCQARICLAHAVTTRYYMMFLLAILLVDMWFISSWEMFLLVGLLHLFG